MKCNWTTEDVLKQLDILRDMIAKETNIDRKLYLQKVLDSTEYILFERYSKIKAPSEGMRRRLYNINGEREAYNRYYSIVEDFNSSLEELDESFYEVEDIIEKLFGEEFDLAEITGAHISNGKAISLTREFFDQFDSDLKPYFHEAFDEKETTFRFGKTSGKGIKISDGTTIFIDGVRKNFINVARRKDSSKIFTIIHEYGHAIKNLFNPERVYSNEDGMFEEVEALFPELVALHENVGNIDPLYLAFLKYSTLVTYCNQADYLILHNVILNIWHDNKLKFDDTFFDVLEKDYKVNEEALEKALSTTISDEGVYIISYLVAMELLHIYKKDKQKALELYKEFLSLPHNCDLLPFVVKLVKLNGSILEEATEVVEEMKLQLERYSNDHV